MRRGLDKQRLMDINKHLDGLDCNVIDLKVKSDRDIDYKIDRLLIDKTLSSHEIRDKQNRTKSNARRIVNIPFKKILAIILSFILIFVVMPASLPYLYGNDDSDVAISLYPENVHNGDRMFVNATIPSFYNIHSVTADIGGIETLDLSLIDNSTDQQLWQVVWLAHDVEIGEHTVKITALDPENKSYGAEVRWSVLPEDVVEDDNYSDVTNETGDIINNDTSKEINESSNETTPPTNASINGTSNITITTELQIWDDTDYQKKYTNDTMTFYANYSSFNQIIKNATSLIYFDDRGWSEPIIMNYSDGLYLCTRSFVKSGIYEYRVSCSAAGYENKNITKECNVSSYEVINDSNGRGTGKNVSITKPQPPTNLFAATYNPTRIDLSWTKGVGSNNTYIVRKIGSYPIDRTDGTIVYNGTGTSHSDTELSQLTQYYYRAWSYVQVIYNGTIVSQWSDDYSNTNNKTNTIGPSEIYENFWEEKTGPSGTIGSVKMNYTKAWKFFLNHSLWQLEGWNPQTQQWITEWDGENLNTWLSLKRTSIQNGKGQKIALTVTNHAPIATRFRFTFGVDLRVKDYVNRTGQYEYTMMYNENGRDFYFTFNWSDIIPLVQNGAISLKHGVKNINGTPMYWFRIVGNRNINAGQTFTLDPTYGLIADQSISSFEWDSYNGTYPDVIRLGTSQYYVISAVGGNPTRSAWLYTIKVWDENGTIQQTPIDSWNFFASSNAAVNSHLVHISGDYYAVMYRNGPYYIKTFKVWDTNGTFKKSEIDSLTLSSNGAGISDDHASFIHINNNIYSAVYKDNTNRGVIETFYIDSVGTIGNTVNDTIYFDTACSYPIMVAIDSDSVVIAYSNSTDNGGFLKTYNISNTGDITNTCADYWEYDTTYGLTPAIIKISGNIYAITFRDTNSDLQLKTLTISTSGMITKSWIDTLDVDSSTCYYPYINHVEDLVYSITYQGSGSDGFIRTMNITDAGYIGASYIDSFEFDTADCAWYPTTLWVADNYYLTVYQGTSEDGWSKTYQIFLNDPPTVSDPSPADGSTGISVTPELSINVSDMGDILSVNWSSNSSGSWAKFGTNQTIYSYGALSNSVISSYEWNGNQGSYPCVLRLGESNYYLVFATTSGPLAWVYTLKVWNNNGTIQQSIVDSLQIEATWAGTYSQSLVHLSDDYYALAYCDNFNKVRIKTFTADDADGQIGASTIGSVRLNSAYLSSHQRMVKVSGNMYAVVYVNNSLNATWLSSLYISPVGVYASTFNDTVLVNATYGSFPNIMAIDDDTVVITYTGGASDGYVCTYNISSTGDITNTATSSWDFDTAQASQANICRIYGDTYAIAYEDSSGDGWIKTCSIIDTGAITKSWIDTYEFDNADGGYQTITSIGNNLFAITYQGTDSDGWMKILYISKTGDIASFEYDELEFDTADSISYAPVVSCGNDYYLIVYEGTGNDGWSCTVKIGNTTSIYGTISNVIDSWEYDEEEAEIQGIKGLCRVNNTDIYISAAKGDTGTDDKGIVRTFKVWGNNGTIQKSIIDSLIYDASACYYPHIYHISGTDRYVVGYYDGLMRLATFQVQENGSIGASTIDTQALTYGTEYSTMYQFSDNIYISGGTNDSDGSTGIMETRWIDDDGTINNTRLDFQVLDSTFAKFIEFCKVDSDTIAVQYVTTSNQGEFTIKTYNISSSGVITDTHADSWAHESDPYYYNELNQIGTNMFATTYLTIPGDIYCRTIAIDNDGIITKSYVDTLLVADGTGYATWLINTFMVKDPLAYGDDGMMGCTFEGKINGENDGYICTWRISDDGALGGAVLDISEFSDSDNSNSYVTHMGENNFLVVYTDKDNDGWIKTIKIYNETGTITLRQTNSNFSSLNTKYWWSVNCTDGVNWDNETYSFTTFYETQKPSSNVTDISPYLYNESDNPLTITCTDATGTGGSGLKNATLYYYNSTDNSTWSGPWNFGVDSDPWVACSWSFTFDNGSGCYRFYSIAADNASNVEDAPETNDTECGYDATAPSSSVDTISPYVNTTGSVELTATASDALSDVKNVTLWYRYSTDNSTWENGSCMYRKRLTINQTKVAGPLSNFPILVYFASDSDLASDAQNDGDDIVFTTSTGTKLNHEIESFNGSTGTLSAWVNVTSLSSTTGTVIWMYYGNSTCDSQQNSPGTWDDNFEAVYHLSETSGGSGAIKDSTSNHINGTNSSGVTFSQTGKISNALQFSGTSLGKVDLGNPASFDSTYITAECWLKTSFSVTEDGRLITAGSGATNKWILTVAATNPMTNRAAMSNSASSHATAVTGSTINNGAWQYLAGTRNPEQIYLNGILQSSTLTDSWSFEANSKMGTRGTAKNYSGYLDEVRVSSVTRNASWVTTTYNTISSPSTFFTKGSEESCFWTKLDNASNPDDASPWNWTFNFPNGRGYYEFYSIANDTTGNKEDAPDVADAICRYINDTTKPISSVTAISPYWKKTSPLTITATASDTGGSGLNNVTLYYYNSSNNATWYGPWEFGTDKDPWVYVSWNFNFPTGLGYYRFYSRATDNDSNIEDAPAANDTMCGYETTSPISSVNSISPYWKTSSPQTISGTASDTGGSGLKNSTLWYRYRATNASSWGSWTRWSNAGNPDTTPWSGISWSFNFPSGAGQYQFYSIVADNATNTELAPGSADASCGYDNVAPTSTVANGIINKTKVSTYEWDAEEGSVISPKALLRINGTEYYVTCAMGDTNTDQDGFVRTLRVWNNNGTIQKTVVDKYEYDTSDGRYAEIQWVPGTDKYAVAYYDSGSSVAKVVTIQILSNGSIIKSNIDTISTTTNIFNAQGSLDFINVNKNVFAVLYSKVATMNGFMVTIWINSSGTINDTIISSKEYDTSRSLDIYSYMVDADTILISYTDVNTDLKLVTYNISSSGAIAASATSYWVPAAGTDKDPVIIKVAPNIFNILYVDSGNDIQSKTVTITDTGVITKSWIDILVLEPSGTVISSLVPFVVQNSTATTPGIFGVTCYGIDSGEADGYIYTYNITYSGSLDVDRIDRLEFDTNDNSNFANVIYVSNNYFLIVYTGTGEDGWSCTVNIIMNGIPYFKTASPFNISGTGSDNGPSGLKNVTLYYRYSTDNSSWGGWTIFGVDTTPWPGISWSFNFPNGTGYYEFYSIARDNVTNAESAPGSADMICAYLDNQAPSSSVTDITPYWHNSDDNPLTVTCNDATDGGGSGLKNVTLYYYNSTDNSTWSGPWNFDVDSDPWVACNWSFTFDNGSGCYRFYSIAADNASNVEDAPLVNDTGCGYDTVAPSSSVNPITPYVNTTGTVNLTATATDEMGEIENVTLWYRYSTDNSTWWNANWKYRKNHMINASTGAGTDYQIGIKIYKANGADSNETVYGVNMGKVYVGTNCRDDFGDIRFTNDNGSTELSYWMQEYTLGNSAIFWVKINDSLESSTQTIKMYYGNNDALTSSNGTNTFVAFSDFETGIDDWTNINLNTFEQSSAKNYTGTYSLHGKRAATTDVPASAYKTVSFPSSYAYRLAFQISGTNELELSNYYSGAAGYENGVRLYPYGGTFKYKLGTDGSVSTGVSYDTNTWFIGDIRRTNNSNWELAYYNSTGSLLWEKNNCSFTPTETIDRLGITPENNDDLYIDNAFVRKYTSSGNEPGPGNWSSEEAWINWDNASNPDISSPWSWEFDFPNGTGYYEFYSIATDNASNTETAPDTADASCYYQTGEAPYQNGETPTNTSTNIDVCLVPSLYVICRDNNTMDTMTATWWSNSSGSWAQFATNTSIANNTNITQTNSNFSNYTTTYYWSVNLTDGTSWTNETYHFTTQNIQTNIDTINPYNTTTNPLQINATADTCISNVTIWYRYSSDNSTWWNANWKYRKSHIINATSGAGTNYVVGFVVYNGSGTDGYESKYNVTMGKIYCNNYCQADFDDIRFISSDDATVLDYWLEDKTDGVNATFWVEIADDLNSSDSTIYVYHGNNTATSLSNGTNTFIYFDDFSGTLSKWTTIAGTWVITDGKLYPNYAGPAGRIGLYYTGSSILNASVDAKIYFASGALQDQTPSIYFRGDGTLTAGSDNRFLRFYWHTGLGNWQLKADTTIVAQVDTPNANNSWGLVSARFTSDNVMRDYWNNTKIVDNTSSLGSSTGRVGISAYWGSSSCNNAWVDDFRVRKYVEPEPGQGSWGSEESWIQWSDGSNPDTSSPWQWSFDFPNGTGYYEFYSIGKKTGSTDETIPNTEDTSCYYSPPPNQIPYQTGESPTNGSTNVDVCPTTPTLYVTCTDNNTGDTMNATWWSNSSGRWVQFASNNSITNNTNITQTNTNFSNYTTTYYWSVNLTDGTDWNNQTYHFTTQNIQTNIDTINPYTQTTNPLTITATADTCLDNTTLYYRYSNDNNTWWNSSWTYRKKITIDHNQVAENLTNFPILVNITDTNLSSKAQSDGDDITFTNSTGTKLNHEIELFNSTNGELVAWVNVTSLSSTTDTELYMYYGNPTCSNQQNIVGTWDSNYALVLHFEETTGNYQDSTSNNNDGVPSAEVSRSGNYPKIGTNCPDFDGDGNDDYITVYDNPSINFTIEMTWEGWVNTDDVDPATNEGNLISKNTVGSGNGWDIEHYYTSSPAYVLAQNGEGGATSRYSNTAFSVDTWMYRVCGFDDANVYFYNNGTADGSGSFVLQNTVSKNMYMGCAYPASSYLYEFDGTLDEFRLSDVNRSTAWISTSYNTMQNTTTFVQSSTEECWMNYSDPDVSSPWSWEFDFPNGTGYYEFYSIATDDSGNVESAPGTADAICRYYTNTSFTVSPDLWNIGDAWIEGSNATTGYYFTLVNNGNVALDITIKASNATNFTTGFQWDLTDTAGLNNFSLLYNMSGVGVWKNINNTYDAFIENLAKGGYQTFDLKILMATLSSKQDLSMHLQVTFKSVIA